jgi:hypothetical protein
VQIYADSHLFVFMYGSQPAFDGRGEKWVAIPFVCVCLVYYGTIVLYCTRKTGGNVNGEGEESEGKILIPLDFVYCVYGRGR